MSKTELRRHFRRLATALAGVSHCESEFLAVSTFSGGLFSERDFASGFLCNRWRHELRDCIYHGTFLISPHLRYALTRDLGCVLLRGSGTPHFLDLRSIRAQSYLRSAEIGRIC